MSDENNTTNITSLGLEFKDTLQAQIHIKVQHNTIVALSKEVQKLKEKNEHLESIVSKQTPTINKNSIVKSSFENDDEETICRVQLRMIREKSLNTELTLEEAKRVEIYTKILLSKQNQPKTLVVESKNISNDQLLAAFESLENKTNE